MPGARGVACLLLVHVAKARNEDWDVGSNCEWVEEEAAAAAPVLVDGENG